MTARIMKQLLVTVTMLGIAVISCKGSTEAPRREISNAVSRDSTELVVGIDSLPGRQYLENVRVLDEQGNVLIEMQPTKLFETDTARVRIPWGTYGLAADDNSGNQYVVEQLKVSGDTIHWFFDSSDLSPASHLHVGWGSETISLVNGIEYLGMRHYTVDRILISPMSSPTWDMAYLPGSPMRFGDTLSLHLDPGQYDLLIFDNDWDLYLLLESTSGSMHSRTIRLGDFLDPSSASRNVYFRNNIHQSIVSIATLGSSESSNLIEGDPLDPGQDCYLPCAYGSFTAVLKTETGAEYIVPFIKASESLGDLDIRITDEHRVRNPSRLPTHFLGSGGCSMEIVNGIGRDVSVLQLSRIDDPHSVWMLPWYGTSEAIPVGDTLPLVLEEGPYLLWARVEDDLVVIIDTIHVGPEPSRIVLTASMMMSTPMRYTVGEGACRIDLVNSLVASDLIGVHFSPTDSTSWGGPVMGTVSLCPGDTLTLLCDAGTHDIHLLDSDLDTYTVWGIPVASDTMLHWDVTYMEADDYRPDTTWIRNLHVRNNLPYDITLMYLRDHGTFDWDLEEDLLGEDILPAGEVYRCAFESDCFDLRAVCTDFVSYYEDFRLDSICALGDGDVAVDFTPAARFLIEPQEIEPGVYAVGEGPAQLTLVNRLDEPVNYVYLSPSNAVEWGDDLLGRYTLDVGATITISCDPGHYDLACELASYGLTSYGYSITWDLQVVDSEEFLLEHQVDLARQGFEMQEAYRMIYPGGLPTISFVNSMSDVIAELYYRPVGRDSWGKNLLLVERLASEGYIVLPVDPGIYDLKAVVRSEQTWEVIQTFTMTEVVLEDSTEFTWFITGRHLTEER